MKGLRDQLALRRQDAHQIEQAVNSVDVPFGIGRHIPKPRPQGVFGAVQGTVGPLIVNIEEAGTRGRQRPNLPDILDSAGSLFSDGDSFFLTRSRTGTVAPTFVAATRPWAPSLESVDPVSRPGGRDQPD